MYKSTAWTLTMNKSLPRYYRHRSVPRSRWYLQKWTEACGRSTDHYTYLIRTQWIDFSYRNLYISSLYRILLTFKISKCLKNTEPLKSRKPDPTQNRRHLIQGLENFRGTVLESKHDCGKVQIRGVFGTPKNIKIGSIAPKLRDFKNWYIFEN